MLNVRGGCVASDQRHVAGTCDPATGVCSTPLALGAVNASAVLDALPNTQTINGNITHSGGICLTARRPSEIADARKKPLGCHAVGSMESPPLFLGARKVLTRCAVQMLEFQKGYFNQGHRLPSESIG